MAEYEKEEWNMAKAYFMDLHEALRMCNYYQIHENPYSWLKWLKVLYKMTVSKMNNDEKIEVTKLLNEAELTKPRTNVRKMVSTKPFWDLELYIREFLEKKGMLTPKSDDPRFAYGA